jgi:hypothetical protein
MANAAIGTTGAAVRAGDQRRHPGHRAPEMPRRCGQASGFCRIACSAAPAAAGPAHGRAEHPAAGARKRIR